MRKSVLAAIALVGASVMFAAPQSEPAKTTGQTTKTQKVKKARHKKEHAPKQQTPSEQK